MALKKIDLFENLFNSLFSILERVYGALINIGLIIGSISGAF